MIQVHGRGVEPHILQTNKVAWLTDLTIKIADFDTFVLSKGGIVGMSLTNFKKLSVSSTDVTQFNSLRKTVDEAVEEYKKPEIQNAIKSFSTKNKCVFCEKFVEDKEGDIEHYYPKSLYPLQTFEWINMFWACQNCNRYGKRMHDTLTNPIIHPENDNPELFFEYDNVAIIISTTTDTRKALIAQTTINVLKFDERISLSTERFNLKLDFDNMVSELEIHLKQYKLNLELNTLQDFIRKLNHQRTISQDHRQFAGYYRFLLRNNHTINDIITEINKRKEDLGLTIPFELY